MRDSDYIYCDYADPRSIEELNRHGFNAEPCERKDVKESILKIKSMPLYVTQRSAKLIKELKNYKWKTDKDGKVLDQPVKFLDDGVDALRYSVFSHCARPRATWCAF